MEHLMPVIITLGLTSALLATVLVVLGVRAYRKTKDPRMLRLTGGFILLLASLGIEAFSFNVLFPGDLMVAHVLEGSLQLGAFAVLIWALF